MQQETTRRKWMWVGVNAVVLLYAFVPVIWIVSLSLKDAGSLNDGNFFPRSITWASYQQIFANNDFTRALINSIGICIISTFLAILLAMFAAYAIARLDFPGKGLIVGLSLMISMFPQIALVTPLFRIETAIGLFDTWLGLIIPYITFALPLGIYTMSAFFREIPWEMEQAAQVDGATSWQAFRKVIVPLAAPGVFTAAILTFFFAWNEFVLAISLTSTTSSRTVPAQLSYFVGPDPFNPPYAQLATASVIVTLPVIVIVLLFQRKIVAGLTSGAVKG